MKIVPTVADALAGGRYLPPMQSPKKSVLIAGAAGRLGERILSRALGAQDYDRTYVLASDPMLSTEAKLTALRQSDWNSSVDHVIAIVSDEGKRPAHLARKRTQVFSSLTTEQVIPLAHQAKSLGASRFMLVTPTNILLQPSAVYAQLANPMEAELHRIGFDALFLVRPSDHEFRQRRKGLAARLPGLLIDTVTSFMTGTRYAPLTIDDIARAAVRAMQDGVSGLWIIEPDRLHQLVRS
jgi:uncharacterized protein YbjT (DUF2867 family)